MLPARGGPALTKRNQAFECTHWERTSYITCKKGQLPEGSMESLATTIRFVTLNCRTLSSELQQAALSRLLRYLCVPFAALQETRMRDRPVISIENYTIYCGDADENKVGGCAIAVRNDYKNLVEFGTTSSRCAFLRPRNRQRT